MKRRFLALLLTLTMMLSLVPTVALAVDGAETPNTDSWAGCTSCSEGSPHMISTKAELDNIRTHIKTTEDGKKVINGYFKLANDIAFDESDFAENGDFYNEGQGWLPLDGVGWINGSKNNFYSTRFTGTLDGDEHTISGIISNAEMSSDASKSDVYNKKNETATDAYSTGLFSCIENGTVKNLTLKSFKLYNDESSPRIIAGALSGYVRGATVWNVTVVDSEMYGENCGGIAGYGLSTSFTGCKVANTVIYSQGHCGGIIGQVRSGVTVKNCDVDIVIEDLPDDDKENRSWNGGIWGDHGNGWLQDASRIENVTVKFKYSSENQGKVGGLIGGCYSTDNGTGRIAVTIDGAIVDVDIDTGTNMSKVGGIFGQVTSTTDRSIKSTISNVIVRGTIKSGEHTSTTVSPDNTVSAIGWCHGKWSNTGSKEPSNVLKNIYVSITNTGDQPLPAITYSNKEETPYPFSLENVVFAGQETIDGIVFPAGSSYKVYKNPVEIAYGEANTEWLGKIGDPSTTDTVSIEDDSVISIESGELCGKKLGSTNVVVHVNMNGGNYTLAKIPVTVSRASVDVTMTDATETYDGTPKTIAAAESAALPDDLTLVYSYKESSAEDSSYSNDAPTDCGTYTVKVESGSENYELTGTTTATLTITPANLSSATVTPAQNPIKYDGKEIKPDVSVVLNGTTLVADKDYSIAYSDNTGAGTAKITVTGKGNYAGTATGTFKIDETAPTVKAENVSTTYDAKVHTVEVTASSGTVKYYTDAQTSTEFTGESNVGEHKVYYKVTGADNFSGDVTGYVMLNIAPAPLTIKADDQSVRVGGTMPTYTYTVSGLCGSDMLSTEPTLNCSADGKTAGSFDIIPSGADAGSNYDITYQNGTLTVYRSSSGGSSSTTSNTTTKTTTNADGSTTTTVTNKITGTVTETTKNTDGSTLVVVTEKDGAVTTTETRTDGVTVKTVDEPRKDVTATVSIPRSVGTATVTIPADTTPGTVAVDADTGKIIKLSVPTEDGLTVKLDGSANLVLVDKSKDFTDTNNHWAKDTIDFVTAHDMFQGTSADTYSPENTMTRAMLMTVLARFDGQDTTGGSVWYEKGMEWAKANGVSDGSNPDGSITREQFAAMLYRYAGSPTVSGGIDTFSDAGKVSGYATDAMRWAVSTGVIGGMGDGTLAPQGNATRAQVAAMLMRFCTNLTK